MKALSQTQLQQLLSAVDSQSPFGLRDRLVVTFLLHTGLEPVELVGLNVDHVLEGSQVLERLHLAATLAGDGRARTVVLDQVARRSGNTDPQFARMPTLAVFGQIKQMVNAQTRDQVAEALSPEVRELWQQA